MATQTQPQSQKSAQTPLIKQFVNFGFYKLDTAWRHLAQSERDRLKAEFADLVQKWTDKILVLSYSTVGTRADTDFLLWKISERLEDIQEMTSELLKSGLGKYLHKPHNFLAMTKRSMYVAKHEHPGSEGSRTRVTPGNYKYFFVYPFVKTRDWYLLPPEERQAMMQSHIELGHKYPSVKLNTTYSFGLDDQEFVVAFETDKPSDFLDLVMELRGTRVSKFTLRDTPIFTCIKGDMRPILDQLG
jgi:chlorite dismutase